MWAGVNFGVNGVKLLNERVFLNVFQNSCIQIPYRIKQGGEYLTDIWGSEEDKKMFLLI